jgi:dTMP kinase
MFITFEGPEGGGKSTQITILDSKLKNAGFETLVTRQPGGEALGAKLRSIMLDSSSLQIEPMAELLMMMADRAQSVARLIAPALDKGITVICDRYADSSVAYQGYGRNLDYKTVRDLNAIATAGLLPDITFLLDIEPSIGLLRQTNKTRMEAEALDFHSRVRQGYLESARQEPNRFRVIDANLSVDSVAGQIWSHYEAYCRDSA